MGLLLNDRRHMEGIIVKESVVENRALLFKIVPSYYELSLKDIQICIGLNHPVL